MNLPVNPSTTMTSTMLLELINDSRAVHGEPAVRRNDFISRCKDELEGEHYESFVVQNLNKTESEELRLSRDQCLLVAMRESKGVRRRVVDKLNALDRPMTQAELIAASANHLVAIERQQAEQQQALARVEQRVEQVETLRFLTSRPTAFESISHIRERINKRYGLPAWVIDLVMRELNRSPMPFAMVKSDRAEEGAKPYPIWPTAGVTRLFDQFVAECQRVTAERATHPEIADRFKIRPERAV